MAVEMMNEGEFVSFGIYLRGVGSTWCSLYDSQEGLLGRKI